MGIALVTGGAGFIGSHLVNHLLDSGYAVKILDNLSTGHKENLDDIIGRVEFIEGDIRDQKIVKKAVQGVDFVFHLAAQISVVASMSDPAGCFDVNVMGTNNLLQHSAAAGVKKVVLSSSAAVYGEQEKLPIQENSEMHPLSPYATSKLMDEALADLYSRSFQLQTVCLRYFNVFGPRQDPYSPYAAAIPIFIQALMNEKTPVIYGDGRQTRDFIYVSDVARANLMAAEKGAGGSVMNICSGKQISILDLVSELHRYFPGKQQPDLQPARSGDIYNSYGSPVRSYDLLGFRSEVEFRDGLKWTIEWMKK